MKITAHTDYALRVLIQVGLAGGELVRIADVARSYDISRNHLMKIVQRLGARGYLETMQGRRGGIRLARAPDSISVGHVVRDFEEGIPLVECFNPEKSHCRIHGPCRLKRALAVAKEAFLRSLDSVSLADLLIPDRQLRRLLAVGETPRLPVAGST